MEYAKYLVSIQPSTVSTIQMKAVESQDNDSIVLISTDVEVTIDSWKIPMSLYCQEVDDTCLILSWESIGIVPDSIEYVITESFVFGCHTPGVATDNNDNNVLTKEEVKNFSITSHDIEGESYNFSRIEYGNENIINDGNCLDTWSRNEVLEAIKPTGEVSCVYPRSYCEYCTTITTCFSKCKTMSSFICTSMFISNS